VGVEYPEARGERMKVNDDGEPSTISIAEKYKYYKLQ